MYSNTQTQSLQLDQYTTPRIFPATPYLDTAITKLSLMNSPTQHTLPIRQYQQPAQQKNNSQKVSHNQHFGRHVFPQAPRQDDPYRCNFISQLTGSYEIDTTTGVDKVSVIVPDTPEIGEAYAIARRVCDDGEALPDKFIYEEPLYFTLCSVERKVHAVMQKGINMKYSVKWRLMDGSEVIWRRTEVVFSMVSVDTLSCSSRRHSISSLYSTASTSVVSRCIEPSDKEHVGHLIRPELLQMYSPPTYHRNEPRRFTQQSINEKSDNLIDQTQKTNQVVGISRLPDFSVKERQVRDESNRNLKSKEVYSQELASSTMSEERLFEQIKADCLRCPSLLRRLLSWGSGRIASQPVTRKLNMDISVGRLWVAAKPLIPSNEKVQDALDDIKGAYQEINQTGIWQQPVPQVGEPGVQHRLLKDCRGYWMIEERISQEENKNGKEWAVCAREVSEDQWVDLKNDRAEIYVRLVPMIAILDQMMENQTAAESADVQQSSVEFLFKTCNQKKLNTKLKKRNLKHNIVNLRVKMDKQYALSFAVKVAQTAEALITELGE